MPVMTISREYGSMGGDLARSVAQLLGYHLADKTTIGIILSQYGLVEFDAEYDSSPNFWARFDARKEQRREMIVEMLNRVVLTLAQHGDVIILGRGSFAVLGKYADVLNVRIQALLPVRIQRVMAEQKITDLLQAEALLKENDHVRASFIETYYGLHWDAAGSFDVVIDTSKVPIELATTWLVQAMNSLKHRKLVSDCLTTAIAVDPVLALAVASELKCHIRHKR
jgi:cytidylate kinase